MKPPTVMFRNSKLIINDFSMVESVLTKFKISPPCGLGALKSVPMFRICEGVSKSFGTGRLERELQIVQLSVTRCSYIAIF